MVRPRILLADDHTLVVEGFRKLLEPECEIAGVVSDGRTLLTVALQTKPDIVVLDLGLPLLSGMDAGRELKRLMPLIKIIVVTMNEDPEVARVALRQWAAAYLVKKSAVLLCGVARLAGASGRVTLCVGAGIPAMRTIAPDRPPALGTLSQLKEPRIGD